MSSRPTQHGFQSRSQRQKRVRQGFWSEHLAALMLQFKGYQVLARQFRVNSGEIDLIVRRRKRLAFVEVKQRQTFVDAEAAISQKQRLRIRKAADVWLSRREDILDCDLCFDVVFVVPWRWPKHLENAL